MASFRLSLEYDGSGFAGWQIQRGGQRTVQGVLHEAFRRVTGQDVRVIGAGRTDSGVHAEAQVASVTLDSDLGPERLGRALNGVLPDDVSVRECAAMPDGFHARYDAREKLYHYRIWNGASRSPLRAARWHWVPSRLDVAAMALAGAACVGSHDFAAFQAAGSEVRSTVRHLSRVEVTGEARGEVDLFVAGEGFLRHMVRILAGTLIEVGLGRRHPEAIPAVLASRERPRAGRTAPAHGLTLERVDY